MEQYIVNLRRIEISIITHTGGYWVNLNILSCVYLKRYVSFSFLKSTLLVLNNVGKENSKSITCRASPHH